MRITTLHYERKRSDGSYGNRSLSLTVELEEGEDLTLAIENVTGLVRAHLDRDEQQEEEERQRREEEQRARYAALREERARQRDAAHQATGLDPGDEDDEDDTDADDEDDEDDLPY